MASPSGWPANTSPPTPPAGVSQQPPNPSQPNSNWLIAFGKFLITSVIAEVAIAFGGIDILGFEPLAFLKQFGISLQAQATQAFEAANAAQTTAQAATTVQAQQSVAKPGYLAADSTADAVFPISNITGASVTTLNVTAGQSMIGFIGTPDNGKKASIIWLGQGTTGLTGFYINLYQINVSTGVCTLMEASTNIISSVSNSMAWNYYDLATSINTEVGHVYAVELAVIGTGTYQIAGMTSAVPANTGVFPSQSGGYRTPIAATYDATGPGLTTTASGTSSSGTTTHTAAVGAAVVVELAVATAAGATVGSYTRTVTYGGVAMTSLGVASYNAATDGWVELFGLTNAPGGTKTIAYSVSGGSVSLKTVEVNSLSYNGVRGFGTVVTATGAGTALSSGSIAANVGAEIVTAFGMISGSASPIVSFSGTSRKTDAINNGTFFAQSNIGDTPGGTTSLTVTATSSSNHWAAVSVPLLPSLEPAPSVMTPSYSGNIPWFGLGGFLFAGPLTTNYNVAGTYTYTIPSWMKWGDKIDVVGVSAGAGGQASAFYLVGNGGNPGVWVTQTLIYGVDIPLTTTTLTIVLGPGGGAGSAAGQIGADGGDFTLTGTGVPTISAPGGTGKTGGNTAGPGPGNQVYNGITYPGGATVGTGAPGAAPGGAGGGGGAYGGGGHGADAGGWVVAYQAGSTP